MILKKFFLIDLFAVLAVGAIGVEADDVVLKATCTYGGMVTFSGQVVLASDVVQNISFDNTSSNGRPLRE
jgi:hypothetical protein